MFKKIFGFFLQIIKNVIYFLYCKRDKIQQGTEKLLNCWVYEIIAIFGLIAACLGLGFGTQDWMKGGMVWVGPSAFTFVINMFLLFNYFQVMKRATAEEVELHLPPHVKRWLIVNVCLAPIWIIGIYAKGVLYRHYLGLYKKRQLPWANPDDSWSAKRKRLKEAKMAAQKKNQGAKISMKAQNNNQSSQINKSKVAPTTTTTNRSVKQKS